MKVVLLQLAATLTLVGAANANTIIVSGSDIENGIFSSATNYHFQTAGSYKINTGQTGFSSTTGTLETDDGVVYSNYLSQLGGGTLTGALLNYSGLFNSLTVSVSAHDSPFFTPVFSMSPDSPTLVRITSVLNSTGVTLNTGATGIIDLWPAFQQDLLAGNGLSVDWVLPFHYEADLGGYQDTCKSCRADFSLEGTGNFTASSTSNFLTLTGIPPSEPPPSQAPVPEPATLMLAGAGLIAAGVTGHLRRNK